MIFNKVRIGAIAVTIAIFTLFAPNQAGAADTKCWIYINGYCGGAPGNTWFQDNYNGSGSSAGSCLHRASEYHNWCGLPNYVWVDAAFNLSGTTINAILYYSTSQYQFYGLNWAPLYPY